METALPPTYPNPTHFSLYSVGFPHTLPVDVVVMADLKLLILTFGTSYLIWDLPQHVLGYGSGLILANGTLR